VIYCLLSTRFCEASSSWSTGQKILEYP